MAQQLTREVRLRGASDIINNDTDLNSLVKQVDTLHLAYLASQMQNGN
jgi:dephospho-CoA kinase